MRALAAATGALLVLTACTQARDVGRRVEQSLNPFASTRVTLSEVQRRGAFLIVRFEDRDAQLTFYAPAASDACTSLLRPGATVTYRKHGNFGRFEEGELRCDPVGVGSLAAWRDRRRRDSRDRTPVPRAQANFREVERYEDVVLVRGRFPLASRVGVPAGFDLIAFVPPVEECRRPLELGTASMEFLPAGRTAIRLVGERGPCPVLGFARPIEETASAR
jgi:hypothetical protein